MDHIVEEIYSHVIFTIPIFGGILVTDAVVVTWMIMGILIAASLLLVRNFKMIPDGAQNIVEITIGGLNSFIEGIIGHEWRVFAPYLGTIALYLALADLISIFGFGLMPPTKNLNVTAALSVMSIVLVMISSIRFKGIKGWLRDFIEPAPIILPMKILELFIRPLSLCMRLFGNILGAFIIMKLLELAIPIGVTPVFSLYFDIFDGLIQMFVFIFLTTLFIKEAIE